MKNWTKGGRNTKKDLRGFLVRPSICKFHEFVCNVWSEIVKL